MEEKDRLEEMRADIRKRLSELKKEKKLLEEWMKEGKKRERNWEIRIRICEEKTEEVVREIKRIKEQIES